MKDVRVSLSTLLITSAIVGAGAFAAGRSTNGSNANSSVQAEPSRAEPVPPIPSDPAEGPLPVGHPAMGATGATGDLPPGHPAVGSPGVGSPAQGAADSTETTRPETNLSWKVPPAWKVVPNTSSMRLATYLVPRAAGDSADADVSVMQAGGSIQANADRWVDQFGPEAKKTAKTTVKKIGGLDVTIVEVEGRYGGMGGEAKEGWALVGAIVATPDLAHFFKITGPARTARAARADLEALLASMSLRGAEAGARPAPH